VAASGCALWAGSNVVARARDGEGFPVIQFASSGSGARYRLMAPRAIAREKRFGAFAMGHDCRLARGRSSNKTSWTTARAARSGPARQRGAGGPSSSTTGPPARPGAGLSEGRARGRISPFPQRGPALGRRADPTSRCSGARWSGRAAGAAPDLSTGKSALDAERRTGARQAEVRTPGTLRHDAFRGQLIRPAKGKALGARVFAQRCRAGARDTLRGGK